MNRLFPQKRAQVNAIAESSPDELLLQGSFWLSQRSLIILCSVSLLGVVLLAPYTYQNVDTFIFLTILIHSLALWGVFLTTKAIARIEVETAILIVIETRASSLLRALKARQIIVELHTLEEKILPENNAIPAPAMIRLFQHICKEASDRKFESSVSVLEPYREEPLEDVFKLQNLQKIALWLGILGTFIGLMLAISQGNLNQAEEAQQLPGLVRNMFADLYVSFSASLAGLEVAVVLGFLLLLLRKKHESYFERMETSVTTMLSLARNALNRDDFLAEFSQVSTVMSQLSDSVAAQTTVLSNRLDDLQKQIIIQNQQINQGLVKLMTTGQEFDGFLSGVSDTQKQFITDVASVYDAVSLRNLGSTLQESVVYAGREISEAIKPNVLLVSTQLAEFNNSVATLNQTLNARSQNIAESVQSLERKFNEQAFGNVNLVNNLRNQLADDLKRAGGTGNQQVSRSDLQELLRTLSLINRKLDAPRNSGSSASRAFRDAFAGLAGRLVRRVYPRFATRRASGNNRIS